MKEFQEAKTLVELAGLFMVVLPTLLMAILALKWHFEKKGKDNKYGKY